MLIKKLRERAWSIQNLILIKTSKSIKNTNLNCLTYIYINKQILNYLVQKSTKSKLEYTYELEIKRRPS